MTDLNQKNQQILDELARLQGSIANDSQISAAITEQIANLQKQNQEIGQVLDSMDKSNSAIADMVTTSQNTRQNLEQIMGNSRDDLKNYRSTLTQSTVPQISQSLDGLAVVSGEMSATLSGITPMVDQLSTMLQQLQTSLDAYFGRWMLFVVLAVIQGFIVCIGDIVLLKVQCVHPVLFVASGMFCSFIYVNIIFAMALTFKHIGKALGVFLIILQIPGSSGTYPIEMMPGFFKKLNPFLLVFLILSFVLPAKFVFLVLWIISLIALVVYLICVEYVHDRIVRQLEMSGLEPEELVKKIKEGDI